MKHVSHVFVWASLIITARSVDVTHPDANTKMVFFHGIKGEYGNTAQINTHPTTYTWEKTSDGSGETIGSSNGDLHECQDGGNASAQSSMLG